MIDGRDAVNSSLRMTRRNIPSAGMNEELEGRKGLTNDSPTVLQSTDPCVHDVVLPFPFSVSTTTVIIEFDRAFNCFRLSTNERILVFNLSHRSAIAPFGISVETSGLLIVRVIRSTVHWNRIERC